MFQVELIDTTWGTLESTRKASASEVQSLRVTMDGACERLPDMWEKGEPLPGHFAWVSACGRCAIMVTPL